MNQYFVTFSIPAATIDQWMGAVSAEEREKQSNEIMQGWKTWMETHKDSIVDGGRPIGKTKRVTADGVMDVRNDLNWYMVVKADSHEAAADMFKGHPHLQIPTSYVEVMDSNRPGM